MPARPYCRVEGRIFRWLDSKLEFKAMQREKMPPHLKERTQAVPAHTPRSSVANYGTTPPHNLADKSRA